MILYSAEEPSAIFHSNPGWLLLVVVCGLFCLAAPTLGVIGLVLGMRRGRTTAAVFGWIGIAFALFAAMLLVSFPLTLFDVIAFILFAPFVTLLAIIGVVGGILSLVFAIRRPAPVST
ncbi:hypothetical protein [Microbacterium sp. RURRCA19A]|uniref:hypothetical protein n=1 Tax=Microbacterium sp. RURRCA19A TaxID=1907391 RepID=UPI000954B646|nr:hypothetical protein [Microbacterium sp. RURRCA19A]SIS10753.1 hypothetical protein SAMN05880568_2814 [Microbacterium sp. RURRCA19A]